MSEMMDAVNAFSNLLKIGWVVWIAWGVGQWFWYRHERSPYAAAPAAATVRKVPPYRKAAAEAVVRDLVTPEPAFDTSPVIETFSSVSNDLDRFVAGVGDGSRRRGSRSAHAGEVNSSDTSGISPSI